MPDDLDAVRLETHTHPWFASPPNHMTGWEAFGVAPGPPPIVRRLGMVTFIKGALTTDEKPGTEAWGKGEVRLGVAGITIAASADDPERAFIQVIGTEEADVAARWDVAAQTWSAFRTSLWPKSRSDHG